MKNISGTETEESYSRFEPAATRTRTIKVGNLTASDQGFCRWFFSDPQNGGGKIEELTWNEEEDVMLITFEDPQGKIQCIW